MDVSSSAPAPSSGNGSSSAPSTAKLVTPWPDRLVNPPTGDPFFFGTTLQTVPIVVDFGSHRVRAGFSDQLNPYRALILPLEVS